MNSLAVPVFSPPEGAYNVSEMAVEITAPDSDAILFTVNGTTPTLNTPPLDRLWYREPVKITFPATDGPVVYTIRAIAFRFEKGKYAESSLASAEYTRIIPAPVQVACVVSCAPLSKPHLWRVIYTYRSDDGHEREMTVIVGQDVPVWQSPDESIAVPTPPGVSGIVKLECPPLVRWATFGIGNQISSKESFFLAAQ